MLDVVSMHVVSEDGRRQAMIGKHQHGNSFGCVLVTSMLVLVRLSIVFAAVLFCPGFAWSSDRYQLAALDASSNVRMWWMRPEERADGEQVPWLQSLCTRYLIPRSTIAFTSESDMLGTCYASSGWNSNIAKQQSAGNG